MFKEFKEFAFKGNLVDMAVGIMIGGAFATVVKSLVDNVFMPPLGMLLAQVDFKKLQITLKLMLLLMQLLTISLLQKAKLKVALDLKVLKEKLKKPEQC